MRPLEESVCDIHEWDLGRGRPEPLRVGLVAERETEILRARHAH